MEVMGISVQHNRRFLFRVVQTGKDLPLKIVSLQSLDCSKVGDAIEISHKSVLLK